MKRVLSAFLFNVEIYGKMAKLWEKSHPPTFPWAFVWVINMPFQSRLRAKRTRESFFLPPPPQCSITLQKAKLQPPQNPWKHDKVDANKRRQRTDFPGPIIGENLLRNSWLGPEEKWWRQLSYVITRPGCHECLTYTNLIKVLEIIPKLLFVPTSLCFKTAPLHFISVDHHVRTQTGLLHF